MAAAWICSHCHSPSALLHCATILILHVELAKWCCLPILPIKVNKNVPQPCAKFLACCGAVFQYENFPYDQKNRHGILGWQYHFLSIYSKQPLGLVHTRWRPVCFHSGYLLECSHQCSQQKKKLLHFFLYGMLQNACKGTGTHVNALEYPEICVKIRKKGKNLFEHIDNASKMCVKGIC